MLFRSSVAEVLQSMITSLHLICTQLSNVCCRTGMGKFVEHYHRTIPFDAILGGTEDVLADLGVRQAMRHMPKNVRL